MARHSYRRRKIRFYNRTRRRSFRRGRRLRTKYGYKKRNFRARRFT